MLLQTQHISEVDWGAPPQIWHSFRLKKRCCLSFKGYLYNTTDYAFSAQAAALVHRLLLSIPV